MAHDPQQCEYTMRGMQCRKGAEYLVMTQVPPYAETFVCRRHLAIYVDQLLSAQQCPVLVRRHHDWTWS